MDYKHDEDNEEALAYDSGFADGYNKGYAAAKSLQRWIPIDETTPKDRPLLLLFPAMDGTSKSGRHTGSWHPVLRCWDSPLGIRIPSHYMELPEDDAIGNEQRIECCDYDYNIMISEKAVDEVCGDLIAEIMKGHPDYSNK